MPVIEPKDRSLKNLKGSHLWHADLSSCSQRVRAVLAENGQSWESHLLAIPEGEMTTPEYLAINPKGLVPALVHDRMLMTESMDIIDYLDLAIPEPPLLPTDPELVRRMRMPTALYGRWTGIPIWQRGMTERNHWPPIRRRLSDGNRHLLARCSPHVSVSAGMIAIMFAISAAWRLNNDKRRHAVRSRKRPGGLRTTRSPLAPIWTDQIPMGSKVRQAKLLPRGAQDIAPWHLQMRLVGRSKHHPLGHPVL